RSSALRRAPARVPPAPCARSRSQRAGRSAARSRAARPRSTRRAGAAPGRRRAARAGGAPRRRGRADPRGRPDRGRTRCGTAPGRSPRRATVRRANRRCRRQRPEAPGRGRPRGSGGRVQARSSVLLSADATDARGRRLARGLGAGAEGVADLGVVEVVAVAEHDGRALFRRQPVGQLLELLVGRPLVDRLEIRDLARDHAPSAAVLVGHDARGDGQHPGTQVLAVLQRPVATQRAQEGLLERIVRARSDPPAQEGENGVAVVGVEAFERGDGHCGHHGGKRAAAVRCETPAMRVAVVGHTEWIEFLHIPRVPRAGDMRQASRAWEEPGGGGGVAAQQLARLAGACDFFTALGDDEIGRRTQEELERRDVRVYAARRPAPHRRAVTFTDDNGERTITLFTPKLTPRGDDRLPWDELDGVDAVYFTGREAGALREARRAPVLVATARELPTMGEAGVRVDAMVSGASAPWERYEPLDPAPRLVVATRGTSGGDWRAAGEGGTYGAVPPPGPVVDTYGAGDCFAAGLTFALGRGDPPAAALAFAAHCGAYAVTGAGVHVMPPTGD